MSIYQIDAGPGTGKTFTSVTAGKIISEGRRFPANTTKEQETIYKVLSQELPKTRKIAYFAHTNTNKEQIKARLPNDSKVYTFHGAGYGQLIRMYGRQELTKNRLDGFISQITGQTANRLPYDELRAWSGCKKITTYLKVEWLEPTDDNLAYLKVKYPDLSLIYIPKDWRSRVEDLLSRSAVPNKKVDYADQVWLAAKRLTRPVYDIGIVDESQDIGGATYQLVNRMCRHIVFCGDPNQAINAFAGADEGMFQKIIELSSAIFPLKTTFRLPPNLITRANRIIPNSVLPGPNKIPGEELNIGYSNFVKRLSELEPKHTLTMSRTNAPLITLALTLSLKGVPVKLADKDLAGRLQGQLKSIGINDKTFHSRERLLDEYLARITKRDNPLLLMAAEDYCECIRQLSSGCNTYAELQGQIKDICSVKDNCDYHLFSTVHKAKGLEADNCFILNPPIEHPLANQNPIGMQQETNVRFVAETRSKANQYYVVP